MSSTPLSTLLTFGAHVQIKAAGSHDLPRASSDPNAKDGQCHMHFNIHLCTNPPSNNVGQPGDVYFDGYSRVFVRDVSGWVSWTAKDRMVWPGRAHPNITNYVLLYTQTRGVFWGKPDTVAGNSAGPDWDPNPRHLAEATIKYWLYHFSRRPAPSSQDIKQMASQLGIPIPIDRPDETGAGESDVDMLGTRPLSKFQQPPTDDGADLSSRTTPLPCPKSPPSLPKPPQSDTVNPPRFRNIRRVRHVSPEVRRRLPREASPNPGWTTLQESKPAHTPERRSPSNAASPEAMDVSEAEVSDMIPNQSLLHRLRAAPDTLTRHRIGKECAANTRIVRWASGIETVLPPAFEVGFHLFTCATSLTHTAV